MKYQIVIEKRAQKFIHKLPKSDKERLLKAIYYLPDGDIKHMQGHNNYYRLRVGDYRVIYTIDNDKLIICVADIGNRGDIYKRY